MAKKTVSKSDAIREAIAANPSAKVSEIVAVLNGKGFKVSSNLVYVIKRRGTKKAKAARAERQVSRESRMANPVDLIRNVHQVAEQAGGIKQLRDLIEILSKS